MQLYSPVFHSLHSAIPVAHGIFLAIGSIPCCPHGGLSWKQWNSSNSYYASRHYHSIAL